MRHVPPRRSTRAFRPRRAFSIIEVLMVVAVLAIMSGIVVPQVSSAVIEAKEAAMLADLRELSSAIERYRVDHTGQPPDLLSSRGLPQLTSLTNVEGDVGSGAGFVFGPYLTGGMPVNPLNESRDVYRVNGSPPANLDKRVGWAYNPATGNIWAGLYVGVVDSSAGGAQNPGLETP